MNITNVGSILYVHARIYYQQLKLPFVFKRSSSEKDDLRLLFCTCMHRTQHKQHTHNSLVHHFIQFSIVIDNYLHYSCSPLVVVCVLYVVLTLVAAKEDIASHFCF
jgi:hypothetical protein